jgi:F0F1-type ATP synthase assembly protein I
VATEEPGSPPSKEPRKRPLGFVRQLSLALELPVIPLAGVLAGGSLGYLIDARAHTRPVFTMLLGAAGVAAGIAEMIRRASRQE